MTSFTCKMQSSHSIHITSISQQRICFQNFENSIQVEATNWYLKVPNCEIDTNSVMQIIDDFHVVVFDCCIYAFLVEFEGLMVLFTKVDHIVTTARNCVFWQFWRRLHWIQIHPQKFEYLDRVEKCSVFNKCRQWRELAVDHFIWFKNCGWNFFCQIEIVLWKIVLEFQLFDSFWTCRCRCF